MNFKTTLILIILLSIITPISIFIIQKDPQQEIERKRTFLYTIPEEEIISLTVKNNDNIVEFELIDANWRIYSNKLNYPVNYSRWSGITFLIKEPVIQRQIILNQNTNIDDFGLKTPVMTATIGLNENSKFDTFKIYFGDLSPDGTYQYVKLNNDEKIYALNTSFGNAIKYLLESPPYPEWVYNFEKENINEILIYESGDLLKGFGRNIFSENDNNWKICDILIDELTGKSYTEKEPCEGVKDLNSNYAEEILNLMINPKINQVVVTGLETEDDFSQYGIDKNSTYIYLRNNTFSRNGSLLIKPVTLSLGKFERKFYQSSEINAVFQDTADIVKLDYDWASELGQVIYCTDQNTNKKSELNCNY